MARVTKSLSVPVGQWVNIQFAFSQNKGYDLRAYGPQRQLLQSVKSTTKLAAQVPTNKVNLFKYFKGRARDFALFESRYSLPINTKPGSGDTDSMKKSNLMVYFNLEEANFVKNSESGVLESLPIAEEKMDKSLYVNKASSISFDYV